MAQKRRSVQTGTTSSAVPTQEDLAREYAYVLTDLRKIGILALALLILLIVLAFVLV